MTLKDTAVIDLKDKKVLPLCPTCYVPFKQRAKRSLFLKFIFRKQNFKKYWYEKCNSTFNIIEEKG
jgi:hypothetical protein